MENEGSGPRRDPWASPAREGGFELAAPAPLTGVERFTGTDVRVSEYWAWAYSDLASNTNRARLTEFLVARALGDRRPLREEWVDFDVLSADGVRVEVKSAAYLQRWRQWKPSVIRFSGFSGRSWDPRTGYFASERTIRADVFVFAVQTSLDPGAYNPLDVGQWEFYVVGAPAIAAFGWRSANLAWVKRAAGGSVAYTGLAAAVARVAGGQSA